MDNTPPLHRFVISQPLCVLPKQQIRRANIEHAGKSFIERSATDSNMLALAFQRFQNLKEVSVLCGNLRDDSISLRRRDYGEGPSTGRLFSVLLSSAAHANLKLESVCTSYSGYFIHDEGVRVSTLSMPKAMLSSLSNLQRLELCLETSNLIFGRKLYYSHRYADFAGC
jgi:hypothetical protein